jgi:hypothetical protein
MGGEQRQLVERQRPARPCGQREREARHGTGLDFLDDAAERVVIRAGEDVGVLERGTLSTPTASSSAS